MAYDEDYRTAVFGKTERTVGWEGNGEPTPYGALSHSFTLDFIVTASSKELLQEVILPAIKSFLIGRGLTISEEKTRIVEIRQGFDFLGQNVRKYRNKLIIKPMKESIRSFKDKVKSIIKQGRGWNTESLIKKLNPVIRGWANYHRYIQASRAFSDVQMIITKALFRWARRRNSGKTPKWIRQRFFGLSAKGRFSCMVKSKQGKLKLLELLIPCDVPLVRYIKWRGSSNPFNPNDADYFKIRRRANNYCPIESNNLTAALLLKEGLKGA